MQPHILITGGAGYIGSHTAKHFSRNGAMPVVVDDLRRGSAEAVRWGPLVKADIGDPTAMRNVFREYPIEAVIHFAGYIAVGESTRFPEMYFQNNVSATLSLLEVMRSEGVKKIVFSSSAAVYGHPQRVPIPEDHPKQPVSPYGDSKLMVERMLRWCGEAHGLKWVALRYFNAAGADPEGELGEEHDPETHLIPLAISAALGEIPHLQIYGTDYPTEDGTAVRDYLHVTDLAAAHLAAWRYLEQNSESGAFNLGTGAGHSVRQVVAAVERVSGHHVPVKEAPRREGDPAQLIAEVTKARAALAWQPGYSDLDRIVATAWQRKANDAKNAAKF